MDTRTGPHSVIFRKFGNKYGKDIHEREGV
jgi:hypothetical protein